MTDGPGREAREIIEAVLYEDQYEYCEACKGIGSDENAMFWCHTCNGEGYVLEPDGCAVAREVAETDTDAILQTLREAGFEVVRLEQVGWQEGPSNTTHGYVLNVEPVRENSVPVYRVISPSIRETE